MRTYRKGRNTPMQSASCHDRTNQLRALSGATLSGSRRRHQSSGSHETLSFFLRTVVVLCLVAQGFQPLAGGVTAPDCQIVKTSCQAATIVPIPDGGQVGSNITVSGMTLPI